MQLTSKYNCNVVLIKGKRTGNQKLSLNPNGISTCHCDILENDELEELSQHIHETLGGIDIVIDNGVIEQQSIKNEDCRTFVDSTGEKLRSTINVSWHLKILSKCFSNNNWIFRCFSYSCISYQKWKILRVAILWPFNQSNRIRGPFCHRIERLNS